MSQLKHDIVVVPIDFSDASQNALQAAMELTGDVAKLRIVHILPPLEAISPAVVWGDLTDESRTTAVQKYAEDFFKNNGVAGAKLDVRVGIPGHEVTDYAKEQNADLIIISSHGYHGVKRLVLGSVAESIIRHARCAVLVLRRKDAE